MGKRPAKKNVVLVDARKRFQARRDAAARNEAPTPHPVADKPHTTGSPILIGDAMRTPNPSRSSSARLQPLHHTPAFGGILLSVTEALVLIRKYAGEVDKETGRQIRFFSIVAAPVEEADTDEYTERFALRGWNACSTGGSTEQRVVRVQLRHGDPFAMLRDALTQMNGSLPLADSRIAETFRHFDKDPLLMPLVR